MHQPAVYVELVEDMSVVSLATGTARTYVIVPKKYYGLGMNLDEVVACLRVRNATANVGITTKAQWSFDAQVWEDYVASSVISQVTSDGDYRGKLDASDNLPPFIRLVIEVIATSGSAQVGADVTAWGYYKFRV